MHVLHVIDALALGGAERMLVEIANASHAAGIRVSVCVTRSGTQLADRLEPGIEVLVLGRTRTSDLRPLVRLARWIRRNAVDVVHCHGKSSFSLVAVLTASRAIATPVLFHDHHGLGMDARIPWWLPLARRTLAAYVAVYPGGLDWARRAGVPDAHRHLIPNALDLGRVARQVVTGAPLPASSANRLVAIGGIRREKAIDVLLEAIARVHAPVVLHIIGGDADPAYAAACRARAEHADLAGKVSFLGPREDALALAATADLAVHSSRSESGPLVLAEYAACGVPFVSTRVGGVAEELAAAGAGRFVPPEDAAALADAIDTMLALPAAQRRSLADSWRQIAATHFDIAVALPRWRALYTAIAR